MTMTPRARVERIVEQASDKEAVCPSDDARAFAVTLLLREHRRIVRLVTRLQTGKGQTEAALCQPAYQLACTDLKKELEGTR